MVSLSACISKESTYVESFENLKTLPDKNKLNQDLKTKYILVLSGLQIGLGMFSDAKSTLTELHISDNDLPLLLSKAARFFELGMFIEAKKILEHSNTEVAKNSMSEVDQAYIGSMLGYCLLAMDNSEEGFKLLQEKMQ